MMKRNTDKVTMSDGSISSLRRNQGCRCAGGPAAGSVQQAQRAQHSQEAGALAGKGVRNDTMATASAHVDGVQQFAQSVAADDQTRSEVGQDDETEQQVERLKQGVSAFQKEVDDDEEDRRDSKTSSAYRKRYAVGSSAS